MSVSTQSAQLDAGAGQADLDPSDVDSDSQQEHPFKPEIEPPKCAVLSQVVVPSPHVVQILPVRIRSGQYNDVAFLSSQSVRICELKPNGQLSHVHTYTSLPSKIQDAVVFGSKFSPRAAEDSLSAFLKKETPPVAQSSERQLPPQLLVLALACGKLVFLGLTPDGKSWLTTVCEGPRDELLGLRIRLEIDPSMRYIIMVIHDAFMLYEMRPYETLKEEYKSTGYLRPIHRVRAQASQGPWLIHLVSFLHPRPQDRDLILLLFVIIQTRPVPTARMVLRDWEHGEDDIFAKDVPSARLSDEHLLPSMVIPLTLGSSFLLFSGQHILFVKDLLSGSPQVHRIDHSIPANGPRHGLAEPVWTDWARCFRHESFFENEDNVYLAREDGTIVYMELQADSVAPDVNAVEHLPMTLDRAFSTAHHMYYDILIIVGEASSGGVWQLEPRKSMERLSSIDNWSPVLDAAVATRSTSRVTSPTANAPFTDDVGRVGRLFSVCGGEGQGSVTEWRTGFQSRILLDIDLEEPVRQAWVIDKQDGGGFAIILSYPHSTAILEMSESLDDVCAVSEEATGLDLTSRTLHLAEVSDKAVLQVTENAVTLVNDVSQQVWLRDVLDLPDQIADYAHSLGSTLVIVSNLGGTSKVFLFEVSETPMRRATSFDIKAEVTCLYCITVAGSGYVLVGDITEGEPGISAYSPQGLLLCRAALGFIQDLTTNDYEDALTSLCVVAQVADTITLLAGTRRGFLVNAEFDPQKRDMIIWSARKIGEAIVTVFASATRGSVQVHAYACSGRNLLAILGPESSSDSKVGMFYVWPIDQIDRAATCPAVNFLCSLPRSLSAETQASPVLLVSDTRILFADVEHASRPVPRQLPVQGRPYRMIYSRTWDCLVLAVESRGISTLVFMDMDTGQQIARPCGKEKETLSNVSGLGKENDRILSLYEWFYVKDSKAFPFVVAGTDQGSFVVVSVEVDSARTEAEGSRRLQYWTRFRKNHDGPIYSISGNSDRLVFSSGNEIILVHLDPVQKKLVPVLEPFLLGSPAVSLRLAGDKIYALTYSEGLQVLSWPPDVQGDAEGARMVLLYDDEHARKPFAMIDFGSPAISPTEYPLHMISDQSGRVSCLAVPPKTGQQTPQVVSMQLQEIVSMQLTSPIRKFVRTHGRPRWTASDSDRRFGTLPVGQADSSMFGVGFDGTLYHFTLANEELAEFMSWVHHWCRPPPGSSPWRLSLHPNGSHMDEIREFSKGHTPPFLEHVDGKHLRLVLSYSLLDPVVNDINHLADLCNLLRDIGAIPDVLGDDGDTQVELEGKRSLILSRAYEVLRYLLAPSMEPNFPIHGTF